MGMMPWLYEASALPSRAISVSFEGPPQVQEAIVSLSVSALLGDCADDLL